MTRNATKRIVIASLYLGTDDLEQDLVRSVCFHYLLKINITYMYPVCGFLYKFCTCSKGNLAFTHMLGKVNEN